MFWHQFNNVFNICSSIRHRLFIGGSHDLLSPLRAFMNSNYDSMLMPRLHLPIALPSKIVYLLTLYTCLPATVLRGRKKGVGVEGNSASKIIPFAGRENKQKILHFFLLFQASRLVRPGGLSFSKYLGNASN